MRSRFLCVLTETCGTVDRAAGRAHQCNGLLAGTVSDTERTALRINRIGCPVGRITAIYEQTFGQITARAALKIGSNLPWTTKERQLVFPRHTHCVIAARESNTQKQLLD
jgi:hypothetical protein